MSYINRFGQYDTGDSVGQRGPRGPPGVVTVGTGLNLVNSNLSLAFDSTKLMNYTTDTISPTTANNNYTIGHVWVNTTTSKAYVLCSITGGVALWKEITNSTAETLPTMSVDPIESSLVVRNMEGDGHFMNVFLHDFPNLDSQNKVLTTTGQYGEVTSKSLDFSSNDFVCNTLKVNTLTTNNVPLIANSSGAISQTKDVTVDSITSNGPTKMNSAISTDAISELTSGNGVLCYNVMKMANGIKTNTISCYDGTSVTIDKPLKLTDSSYSVSNTILGRDGSTGAITELGYSSTGTASSVVLRDSVGNVLCNNIQLDAAKSKTLLGTNSGGYIISGPTVDVSTSAGDTIVKRDANGGITGKDLMILNQTSKSILGTDSNGKIIAGSLPDTLTSNTITPSSGLLTINGNIKMPNTKELILNDVGSDTAQDESKIILSDRRISNNYKFAGIGYGNLSAVPGIQATTLFTDVATRGLGVVSHVSSSSFPFVWTRSFWDASHDFTDCRVEMELANNKLAVDTVQALTVGSNLTLGSPLKLTGYSTDAGYLYRNADGTTAIQTPAAATTMSYSAVANTGVLRDANKHIEMDGLIKYPNLGWMSNENIRIAKGRDHEFKIDHEIVGGLVKNIFSYTRDGSQLPDNQLDGWWNLQNELPIYKIEIGTKWLDEQDIFGGAINKTYIHGIYANLATAPANQGVVYVNSEGQLTTPGSSRRFKKDIVDIDNSERIYNMHPVKFFYKTDVNCKYLEYGLIAEELEEQGYNDLVIYNDKNIPCSVKYQHIPILTLKEVQKLKEENIQLKADIASMKNDLTLIKEQLANMNVSYKTTAPQLSELGTNNLILFKDENTTNLNAVYKIPGGVKVVDLITNC